MSTGSLTLCLGSICRLLMCQSQKDVSAVRLSQAQCDQPSAPCLQQAAPLQTQLGLAWSQEREHAAHTINTESRVAGSRLV